MGQNVTLNRLKIDVCGRMCPTPILMLSRAIKEIGVGDEVEVTCDDRDFFKDLEAWCDHSGHSVRSLQSRDGKYVAIVARGGR